MVLPHNDDCSAQHLLLTNKNNFFFRNSLFKKHEEGPVSCYISSPPLYMIGPPEILRQACFQVRNSSHIENPGFGHKPRNCSIHPWISMQAPKGTKSLVNSSLGPPQKQSMPQHQPFRTNGWHHAKCIMARSHSKTDF